MRNIDLQDISDMQEIKNDMIVYLCRKSWNQKSVLLSRRPGSKKGRRTVGL